MGEDNVNFLRARYAALQQSELFRGIRYSEDHQQIKEWAPLVMEGRDPQQKVAATRSEVGTDVNYGEITRQLIAGLQTHDNFSLQLGTVVRRFKRNADKSWSVTLADANNRHQKRVIRAKFYLYWRRRRRADPAAETGIPQAKEYAGFPVGGQFLVCENPEVVTHHLAKVYGQAEVGAPPMSVPHIDTRIIDRQTRGAVWAVRDLLNPLPEKRFALGSAGLHQYVEYHADAQRRLDNFDLVKYLISQVLQKDKDRHAALCEYYPEARKEDWRLWQARPARADYQARREEGRRSAPGNRSCQR
ncbi:malate:quinone oxidoreductase [Klebsiella michiganensis]|uniref:malate dehydrogenase (quinone) n=1 Tax=Klebsiella michiganensis TaxID=1134687 RepID=A0A7H4MUZ2_9ENTR|nr:malate:quinone oxidoreductase [Klebsiella michiganensis]